jgi:hypothetical protein
MPEFEMHKIRGLRSLILGNLGILAPFRHFDWPQGLRIATLLEHQNMLYNKIPGHNTINCLKIPDKIREQGAGRSGAAPEAKARQAKKRSIHEIT